MRLVISCARTCARLLLVLACVTGHGKLVASPADTAASPPRPTICMVSDTQAPIIVEQLFLRAKNNRAATRIIFHELLRLRPDEVVHLGDVVPFGFSQSEWEKMDALINPLKEAGIPVHAILGNHEVMFLADEGEANFQARFPQHVRTGYVRVVDSVALVLLNSNISTLGRDHRTRELIWYDSVLTALEHDTAIRAIIVGCHHSPYTNSRIVGASQNVQTYFVPQFLRTPKCRLFVSGHAHTFEHFRREGKDFLVIGGGGGLQHPLYEGEERRFEDLSKPPPKPMFHFLTLERGEDVLTVISHSLSEDSSGFSEYYRLVVPLPSATARP